jgi:hypothetical protein
MKHCIAISAGHRRRNLEKRRTRVTEPKNQEPFGEPPVRRHRAALSPETREKIRLTLLGRKHTDERRQNISDALTGRSLSDKHRAACSRAQMGRVVSDGTRAKISEANRGRKPRPLTRNERLNLSIALQGRIFTEEHRGNLSEAVTGLKVGNRWITGLVTSQERHLPAGEAAVLVATGKWRWGRRPWR